MDLPRHGLPNRAGYGPPSEASRPLTPQSAGLQYRPQTPASAALHDLMTLQAQQVDGYHELIACNSRLSAEICSLKVSNQLLDGNDKRQKTQLAGAIGTMSANKEQMKHLQENLRDLRGRNVDLTGCVDEQRRQKGELDLLIKSGETQRADLDKQLETLRRDVDVKQKVWETEKAKLVAERTTAEQKLADQEKNASAMNDAQQSLESGLKDEIQQRQKAENEKDELRDAVSTIQSGMEDLRTKLDGSSKKIAGLEKNAASLKEKLQAAKDANAELTKELDKSQNDIKRATAENTSQAAEIQQLNRTCRDFEKTRQEVTGLSREVARLELDLEDRMEELRLERDEHKRTCQDLQKAKQETTKLSVQVIKLKLDLERCDKELRSTQSGREKVEIEHIDRVKRLEHDLQSKQGVIARMRGVLGTMDGTEDDTRKTGDQQETHPIGDTRPSPPEDPHHRVDRDSSAHYPSDDEEQSIRSHPTHSLSIPAGNNGSTKSTRNALSGAGRDIVHPSSGNQHAHPTTPSTARSSSVTGIFPNGPSCPGRSSSINSGVLPTGPSKPDRTSFINREMDHFGTEDSRKRKQDAEYSPDKRRRSEQAHRSAPPRSENVWGTRG